MSDALFRIGELSRRTGVSIDVIRAWERRYGLLKPSRTDSNFRMYSADDVARLRLMLHYMSRQVAPSRAAELVRQANTAPLGRNPGVPQAEVRKALDVMRESLDGFEDATAERLLQRLVGVFTPGVVFRDVVLTYLRDLGDRWERGEVSVAQEHFASCFLESWMLSCVRREARPAARRAVLACLPDEHHSLGLTAFGVVLRDLGWSVIFLGRDTPIGSVQDAGDAVGADAIVLAAVRSEPLAAAAADIAALMQTHPVVVGGPAVARCSAELEDRRLLAPDLLSAAHALTGAAQPSMKPVSPPRARR